jgi:CMP-N,N'-diacetyllegionaminic acid synthase
MSMPSCIALIPARSGSKRVTDKNIRVLSGHPLMAYTISAAIASGIFDAVVVSTDSEAYAEIARHYGARTPFLRPMDIAGSTSPDIEWVEWTLSRLTAREQSCDCFSILRPTSPFRLPETIQRAWRQFISLPQADSLRAVEKCREHPGKMWVLRGEVMYPLMPLSPAEQPWHSSQYASLPEVYVQNASLEIAWTRVVRESRTISGQTIMPFLTEGFEGFDINNAEDWILAEHYVGKGTARLPHVPIEPFL